MLHKIMRNKRFLVIATVVAATAFAGIAVAYWTASGSGSGSGSVASSNGSLVLHGTINSALTPGGSSSVTYTADNAGSSSLQVGTVSAVVSIDAEHAAAGCKASDFTIGSTVENQTIAASTSGVTLTNAGSISMANSSENQDACKGATISLALSS